MRKTQSWAVGLAASLSLTFASHTLANEKIVTPKIGYARIPVEIQCASETSQGKPTTDLLEKIEATAFHNGDHSKTKIHFLRASETQRKRMLTGTDKRYQSQMKDLLEEYKARTTSENAFFKNAVLWRRHGITPSFFEKLEATCN